MTTNDQMRHVYETWHCAIVGRDLDKLMALYANESVLDSSAVLVLEKDPSGIIRGRDHIRKYFTSFFAMLGMSDGKDRYRSQQFFWDRKSLVWEYPSKAPDGDQLDVVESIDLEDGLIVYHWVYWGPLVIGTTDQRCQPGRSECLTVGCARWILSWQTRVHAGDWAAHRQAADTQAHATRERRVGKMPEAQSTVIVVDDDPEIREALDSLLRSVGLQVQMLASVPEFLKSAPPDGPTCLILDVRLPGQSGLDFQRELAAANIRLPIIFITGHGDIPMSVQAMKGGALEFLTKPFRDQDLLEAIQLGLARDRARREEDKELTALRERFNTLTAREREVMSIVVKGRLNKQIAADIGVNEVTVKVHRGQVMRKMQAMSLPDLARMADKLKLMPEISKAS